MTYIEYPSDHAFTAFLAGLTPGRVLKDRSAMFSKVERKRDTFLRAKTKHELIAARYSEVQIALRMAREMREAS